VVTLVDGDSDGDGVFDSVDGCVETPNADQADTDGDGLPDACDPNPYCGPVVPAAPVVPPSAVEPCQKALAKAIRKVFDTWAKSSRACLDKFAKGLIVGEPTERCRGGFAKGVGVLPGDAVTGGKIAKAIAKVTTTATILCPDPTLSQLQAC